MILMRHGSTRGNLEGRYVGCRTDEDLCDEGIRRLLQVRCRLPSVERVYHSPMKRCEQSARLLWPQACFVAVPEWTEIDFGIFEGHTWMQMKDWPEYRRFLDSGGTAPFPQGEDPEDFRARTLKAYEALRPHMPQNCAVVAHGGTLMTLMEALARPHQVYFSWQTACAEGFLLRRDGSWKRIV